MNNQPIVTTINRSCDGCVKYLTCKDIETRFKNQLEELRGNWREIYENGERVGTPIRRCSHAILETHKENFTNKRVLEIGCGPLSEINLNFCIMNGVSYTGIDPERPPYNYTFLHKTPYLIRRIQNKLLRTIIKTFDVKTYKINKHQKYIKDFFPSKHLLRNSFDVIYGNSTIEHWHEDLLDNDLSVEAYKKDIASCYELLSENGILIMNCPIYVHGNALFMEGKLSSIDEIFRSAPWKKIIFESWRKEHSDTLPYCPEKRKEYFKNTLKIDLNNIWLYNVIAYK